jgi:hypothetical protein
VARYSTGRPLEAFLTIPPLSLTPGINQSLWQTWEGEDGGGVPADSSFGFKNGEWAKTHNVKNTELAGMLGITPQGITEIFKARNQPTREQVLVMLELMKARR